MEPRPQSSRPAQDSSPSHSGGGGNASASGSYQHPDPTTVVAPPRADYDYSPLDLAPPGQRRRRQLVAAVLGGLVMMLLAGGVVFAFLLLRGDGDQDDEEMNIAAAQTVVAANEPSDAEENSNDPAPSGTERIATTEPGGAATDPATELAEGTASQSEAGDAAGQALGPTPTSPPVGAAAPSGALSEDELFALLPDASVIPQGLDSVSESTRTEADVVDALGGSRDAANRLENWGWSGNVERTYQASNPGALSPDATTFVSVSLHGFASEQAAAEALTYYSDILVRIGYQESASVNVDIGATNRLLTLPQEDGGTEVALYVQAGTVLYRIGGYSPGGDPTLEVLNVADQMIGP